MKTLYVSDLDGTLLRSSERLSDYTCDVINRLAGEGVWFSYATARSLTTAQKVTRGIRVNLPLIVYNGTFVMEPGTGKILIANHFDSSVQAVLDDVFASGIFPIVYGFVEGRECFSYVPELCTPGMREFVESRKGDPRTHAVSTPEALKRGELFYITCIDDPGKLARFYDKYRHTYHCVFQEDFYSHEHWLEIMPANASKSTAARQLQALLGCDRLVAFGDGQNDLDLFEAADEGYAVANAHEALKRRATAILPSNDEDGVAHWLEANAQPARK